MSITQRPYRTMPRSRVRSPSEPPASRSDPVSTSHASNVQGNVTHVRLKTILVTGAAGMLGRKLVERLARDGVLSDERIAHVSLVDVVEPPRPTGVSFGVDTLAADLAKPRVAEQLIALRPDVVFHLAAVVSGEA